MIVADRIRELFRQELPRVDGVYLAHSSNSSGDEQHTSQAFTQKWEAVSTAGEISNGWMEYQFRWYLDCYGFRDLGALEAFIRNRNVIFDAGCGPGHKAAWFAGMNPAAIVVAMDMSEAIFIAAERYASVPNMVFVKGDIANTPFCDGTFDFINCDQVLHHTENPPATLKELYRLLASPGVLHTYVYGRKALPRELLDEHFREYSKQLTSDEMWALSDQVTQLGRALAALDATIAVPDIPALGIKGGTYDVQRFIYWNFLKCFWNPEHGFEGSRIVNYDWYSPSTAFRYSPGEFEEMGAAAGFDIDFVRSEEACHTGRFSK
jgi:SAM-dependent methyltransferase